MAKARKNLPGRKGYKPTTKQKENYYKNIEKSFVATGKALARNSPKKFESLLGRIAK